MYDYKVIDSWVSNVNEVDYEFRIIQYEGSDEFVIEQINPDETTVSEPSTIQMTREQIEGFFADKSKSELETPD